MGNKTTDGLLHLRAEPALEVTSFYCLVIFLLECKYAPSCTHSSYFVREPAQSSTVFFLACVSLLEAWIKEDSICLSLIPMTESGACAPHCYQGKFCAVTRHTMVRSIISQKSLWLHKRTGVTVVSFLTTQLTMQLCLMMCNFMDEYSTELYGGRQYK